MAIRSRILPAAALTIALATPLASVATSAEAAQAATWRHRACVTFTQHINARHWTWLRHHSSRQALGLEKEWRRLGRYRLYGVYDTGKNHVECGYYGGLDIDIVRRSSGRLYATGAWEED